jgi:hypothetical protein
MANRIPLVVDSSNYRIEELPAGDTLDINGTDISGATFSGVSTFSAALHANAGIKFPATQNDVADPNTLDDYEEGTFVAEIQVADGTYDYSGASRLGTGVSVSPYDVGYAHTGTYVKIGGQVTIHIPRFAIPYQGYVGIPTLTNTTWAQGTRALGGAAGRDGHAVGVGSTPMVLGIGSLPFTATKPASGTVSECRGAVFRFNQDRITNVSGPYVGIGTSGGNEIQTLFTRLISNGGVSQNLTLSPTGDAAYSGYLYYDTTLRYAPGNGINDYNDSRLGDITITYNTY